MRVKSVEDTHTVLIEDKEDLLHIRPLIYNRKIGFKRKVYKKDEFKVKRKQEIEWETVTLSCVRSSFNNQNLRIQGMSPKGERVLSVSIGDEFTIYCKYSEFELSIINSLKRKKSLHISVDCDAITVGEIQLNRYKTIKKKYYNLKDEFFDLNLEVNKICQLFKPQDYYKIYYKTSSGLRNLLDGEFWVVCEDPTDWRGESMYTEKYKKLISLALNLPESFPITNEQDLLKSIAQGNVSCLYINEDTSEEILELIYQNHLEPKVLYLPKHSSINWILKNNFFLIPYF